MEEKKLLHKPFIDKGDGLRNKNRGEPHTQTESRVRLKGKYGLKPH